MIKNLALLMTLFALIVSCQAEPGPKNEPLDLKKQGSKDLKGVSFNPAVDILFIIDDSGSMTTFQNELATNAELFIEQFFKTKFIDYHIGVTTSTIDRPIFGGGAAPYGGMLNQVGGYRYVDRNTPASDEILKQMMDVGTSGSGTEEFFSIHVEALSPGNLSTANLGFYRDDAQLAIFVLTDTEDQSDYTHFGAYDFLVDLKGGDEKKLHYIAAVIKKSVSGCDGENMEPRKLEAMAALHKNRGYTFDICKDDYGKDMAQVAANIVKSVSAIPLEEVPSIPTIKVTYGDQVIPNDTEAGWYYDADENSIYISPNLVIRDPEPRELKISYEAIYK